MTNNIAKIRAALEQARELIPEYCGVRTQYDDAFAALAELEKSAAPQFVAGEVARRVWNRAYDLQSECGEDTSAHEESNAWLAAWRAELGPALGMVEIREPTPEECERISMAYYDDEALVDRDHRHLGRDMFNACRAVLWPKEG